MDIKLNEILKLTTEEIENSRIELNMTEEQGGYLTLINGYPLSNPLKLVVYWNVHIGVGLVIKKFNVEQTIFIFLKMSNNEWLF